MDDRGKTAQENIVPTIYEIHGGGMDGLKKAEVGAAGKDIGFGDEHVSGDKTDKANEEASDEYFSGISGKPNFSSKSIAKSVLKVGAVIGLSIVFISAIISVYLTPQFLVGTIDYNLQKTLGFGDTVAILEKQAEYVTATALKEGKVREDYAADLEANNLLVGQIAANGEFVRTDTFIADLGVPKELASTEVVYGNEALDISLGKQEDGQLVMKYGNEIINGDNFVAKVESDPRMYYAYSTALDIATRYYYSDEVTDYYNTHGLSRNSFALWEPSGNKQTDDENFAKMLEKALDNGDAVGIDGLDIEWYEECGKKKNGSKEDCEDDVKYGSEQDCVAALGDKWDECKAIEVPSKTEERDSRGRLCTEETDEVCDEIVLETATRYVRVLKNNSLEETVGGMADAGELVSKVTEGTREYEDVQTATKKAASLLNTAMSSNEPYVAMKTFLVVEESINRARAGNEGPVNQVMDMLAMKNTATITDSDTGETIVTHNSIFNTRNFVAAASDGGPFSKEDAKNYSRDAIINTTNNTMGLGIDSDIISHTANSSGVSKQFNLLVDMHHEGSAEDLSVTSNALNNTFYNDAKETFMSTVGGERTPSGGSELSSEINKYAIGAASSDYGAMTAYNAEVQEIIARKEEAERSSLSPFDISSENTFFGRIAHNFASSMLKNYDKGGATMMGITSAVAGLTDKSIASVTSGAYAADGEVYSMLNGDCPTLNTAAGSEGDIYCNPHTTVSTEYMALTAEDWGEIYEEKEFQEYVALGMGREVTPGVESTDICKRYEEMHPGILTPVANAIKDLYTDFVGIGQYVPQFEECHVSEEENESGVLDKILWGKETPADVVTGAAYSISEQNENSENVKRYSGYALFQMVNSMLTEDENEVTAFRKQYYAEHPRDNSAAGIIARRSGMSKEEAQIALNYADYLTVIANYNPAERMVFGKVKLDIEEKIPIEIKDNQDYSNTLALIVTNKNGQIVRREDNTTA